VSLPPVRMETLPLSFGTYALSSSSS
jgi:hypothetical protein